MEKTVELIICVILPIHTPIGSKRRTIDGPQQNNPVNALFCATYSLVGETLTRSRANEGLPRERGVRKEEPSRREEWNIVASERYTRETDAVPGIRFMSDWNMYDPFLSDGKKIIKCRGHSIRVVLSCTWDRNTIYYDYYYYRSSCCGYRRKGRPRCWSPSTFR